MKYSGFLILTFHFSLFIFHCPPPAHALNDVHVIHLVLDGARADVLEAMIQKGELPHLKKHFFDNGTVFETALTTFPTVSMPGYVSFASGLGAGHSGIFFLEWFDRTREKVVGYLTPKGIRRINVDFLSLPALLDPAQKELYPKATLFEKLNPHPNAVIYAPFRRGAQTAVPSSIPVALIWNAFITQDGHALNARAMKKLKKLFSQKPGKIPRYTLVGLYSTDFYGHKAGPASDELRWTMQKFDDDFGRFLAHLKARDLFNKTVIIVSSDHGMHDTEKRFPIRRFFKQLGLNDKDYVYVGNRGVGSTFVYARGEKGWHDLPTLRRLRAFPSKKGPVDLVAALLAEEAIDWIATRDGKNGARVFTRNGGGWIGPGYAYRYSGKDPFGYANHAHLKHLLNGKPHSAEDWLRATANTDRPNAVVELGQLFEDPQVGDLLVVTQKGWGFRKVKSGTHGSLIPEDMHIPLWIAGPGIPAERRDFARGVDVYPTILHWLGLENDLPQDGKPLFSTVTSKKEPPPAKAAQMKKIRELESLLTDPKNPLQVPGELKSWMGWLFRYYAQTLF